MERQLYPSYPILIIDDEEQFVRTAAMALVAEGITNVQMCCDSREALQMISENHVGIVTLDITMPHISGTDILDEIARDFPQTTVLMVTGVNDVKTAVECMKSGASDYLVKPVNKDELIAAMRKALEYREMKNETAELKQHLLDNRLKHPDAFNNIITCNEKMFNLFRYVESIAATSLPVLITGETGSGKELMASAVHRLSERSGKSITVNVAGVDDTMMSDTLFGHRRGAYSGADIDRKGLIEEATEGTLFLDEIGDLKGESQVKLLRLIQDGSYYPLGSDIPKRSSARIVTATNRNLNAMQACGEFRRDLYYRLEAHIIAIPPLRERLNDIPLLLDIFLEDAALQLKKKKPTYPKELILLLQRYSFPGNVRELKGMVFDAVSRNDSNVLSLDVFKKKTGTASKIPAEGIIIEEKGSALFSTPLPTMHDVEDALIHEAIERAKGNKTLAAHMIGLTRQTLNNWLRRSGIDEAA